MKKVRFTLKLLAVAVLALAAGPMVQAQATRTWVSGVGDDVNPCSRTAPCKTFAGAISKTAVRGEISVLDPGGFGAVTITKSITIDGGQGAGFGSILAAGVNGVIINVSAGDIGGGVVTLRNLSINGAGTGLIGVKIITSSTTKVVIENCQIFGFSGRGISDERTGPAAAKLFVTNTVVRNNANTGIVILPATGTNTITASLNQLSLIGNGNAGLSAATGSHVAISNSVISGNTSFGLVADQIAGAVRLFVENCVVTSNGTGVALLTGAPQVVLSNTYVVDNVTGVSLGGGSVFTFGNNKITQNGTGNGPLTLPVINQQ